MKTWLTLPLLLLSAALLLSGCANLQDMAKAQKPKASVAGVSVADLSLKTITLNTRVKIDNPNPFSLKAAGLALDLSVAGSHLVTVSQPDSSLSLPANGSKEVTLPVTLAFTDLYNAVSGLKNKNEVPYVLQGSVSFALPVLGNISVPLSYEDVLPIPHLPVIKLQSVKLTKAGFSSVQLQLDMLVNNPNAFGVDLQRLGFNLAAQGKSLSRGEVKSVSLASGGSQMLSLPLNLSLSQLGTTLFSLLTGREPVSFSLNGQADIVPESAAWKPSAMTFKSEKSLSL